MTTYRHVKQVAKADCGVGVGQKRFWRHRFVRSGNGSDNAGVSAEVILDVLHENDHSIWSGSFAKTSEEFDGILVGPVVSSIRCNEDRRILDRLFFKEVVGWTSTEWTILD